MKQWGGTGIIARIMNSRLARVIVATGLPTIALDPSEPSRSAAKGVFHSFRELATDSHQAARMAAEHLLEKGLQDYAFVGIPGRVWSDRREKGFCAAIWVGNDGGGNGVYNMSAGQLTTQNWIAVGRAGAIGVLNQIGGTLQLGNNSALGNGGLTVNNGTVDLAGCSPTIASLRGGLAGTVADSNISPVTVAVNQASTTNFAWKRSRRIKV
ncbi:MAG: hypothetical protein ABSG53_03455 [Thermoguttaceae bacterium]|jgi:hypothetical protein